MTLKIIDIVTLPKSYLSRINLWASADFDVLEQLKQMSALILQKWNPLTEEIV